MKYGSESVSVLKKLLLQIANNSDVARECHINYVINKNK